MMKIRSLVRVAAIAALLVAPLAALPAQTKAAGDPKGLVPPPKMWAAQVGPTEFTLAWGRVAAATAYQVLVRAASGEFIPLGTLSASGSRFVVPVARLNALGIGLEDVQFAVRAMQGATAGILGLFNPVSVAKQGAGKALVAPANLTATESSPGIVTVAWDEVPGATAYAIGRSVGTSGYQRFCDVCPTGGTLVDTVPTAGTRYSYRVVALYPMGASRAAMTTPVEVTGLATSGGSVVTGGTSSSGSQPGAQAVAGGIEISVDAVREGLVRIAVHFAMQQGGVAAELVRQACGGPLQVIREIADLVPFDMDDNFGGLDFPECNSVNKRSVRYFVRVRDAKGLVANSKAAVAEVHVAAADTSAGTPAGTADADPKRLVDGITVTPRAAGGARGPAVVRFIVSIAVRVAGGVADAASAGAAQLMRQVCDGPWVAVRSVALDQPYVEVEDAVDAGDAQCQTGKKLVRYRVRVSTAKGLVANSKDGAVELPAAAAVAPATPANARIAHGSDGRRFLTWDAVPGATSYRIERVVGAKGAWRLLREVSGTTTSYTDSISGQPRYRITAVNAAGASTPVVFR